MSYLVRKITKSKWNINSEEYLKTQNPQKIPFDAICLCLKSTQNKLSVWETDTDDWDSLNDVLAALFSSMDRPSKSDIIILDKSKLIEKGLELESNLGESPAVPDINNMHRDLSALNFEKVHALVCEMAPIIYSNELNNNVSRVRLKRYNEKQVISIVRDALAENKIIADDLAQSWKMKLKIP
jgi:hypothetical protein